MPPGAWGSGVQSFRQPSAAHELVELAPLRETGHLLLMRSLAAGGNVAEALAAYERLRMLLRDELGTLPEPTIQAYHRELLR